MAADPLSIPMIERLIGFDTTSRNSNLALIDFVREYLGDLGVESSLIFDDSGAKANLFATLGPADRPGIVLSGHTDVVPVDGQAWDTEPFQVTRKNGRLFARGTSDMKSFIAICLTYAPEILRRRLNTPVHFAFSYDEEVGCIGVRGLIADLAKMPIKPSACIIGEPTEMKVIRAHKGKLSQRCRVSGFECHSSLANQGVNAVEAAAEAVAFLKGLARDRRDNGPYDHELDPPYTTVHTGTIAGGTALNIVPKDCSFEFEFRYVPGDDPQALLAQVRDFVDEQLVPEMRAVSAHTGFEWETLSNIPELSTDEDAGVVQLAKALTGANTTGKVSFGTEGGLFQEVGVPTVVCGPGSIEQAHKPNEFIAVEQIGLCERFMDRLLEHLESQH